ncbi:hypothetical protein IAG44_21575 [Streptomyces roseirectus]|uniref:Uncharacterized protein n=1 Tax=Streptomyces roseirectus TaxID=2768066 RepID=A0A7H0IG46_9ACTN|nr:hypothetical protein [Streptomyces roseirectus]QNP71762.1 hypothetical protein IAG44_21575 [Streptomyces roseirectus]
MSSTRLLSRGRTWLRALAVVLALLVPGEACTVPCVAMAVESVEYDVVDSGLRPSAAPVERAVTVLRPAALPEVPAGVPEQVQERFPETRVPPALSAVRCVVLRC